MTATDLSTIFNQIRDPLLIVSESGRIEHANPSAHALFGAALKSEGSLDALLDSARAKELLRSTGFGLHTLRFQTSTGLKDFSCLSVESGALAPGQGLVMLFLKPAGQILQQESKRALDLITHDLKNPIGAIFGYADVLLDTTAGQDLTTAQRGVLGRIRSTAARAIELIRNYQILGGLSASVREATRASELNAIVTQAIDALWREDGSGTTLSFVPFENDLMVPVDKLQLERVVSNLLGNAIKYTPAGGNIALRTGIEEHMKCLTVTNSGPYIPSPEIAAIFEIYNRASSSRGTAGSGLGLYIVRQIVESAGGRVEVQSSEGSGTSFKVLLP